MCIPSVIFFLDFSFHSCELLSLIIKGARSNAVRIIGVVVIGITIVVDVHKVVRITGVRRTQPPVRGKQYTS